MTSTPYSDIAILIPIGNYPDIANLLVQNITETCGVKNPNIIFLSTRKLNINANVEVVPFLEDDGVHLRLLDWAFENLNFKWGYVQHADMFWKPNNHPWLQNMKSQMGSEISLTIPYELSDGEFQFLKHKYALNGLPLLRTHDFAGLYQRKKIIENKLKFIWGTVKEISSDHLIKIVEQQQLRWIHKNTLVQPNDFLDGSDCIGLEIASRWPDKIKELSMTNRYIHCWDMFAFCMNMRRNGVTLYLDRPLNKCLRGLPTYSWISSHLFDPELMHDKIFPWDILNRFIPSKKTKICKLLSKYKNPNNIGTLGVQQVVFEDYTYRDILL